MRIKSIKLNGSELPKSFITTVSNKELSFIQEHIAESLPEPLKTRKLSKGIELRLPAGSAAQIASFCSNLSAGTTPPRTGVSSEISECLYSIFARFYEEGYEEAL